MFSLLLFNLVFTVFKASIRQDKFSNLINTFGKVVRHKSQVIKNSSFLYIINKFSQKNQFTIALTYVEISLTKEL